MSNSVNLFEFIGVAINS